MVYLFVFQVHRFGDLNLGQKKKPGEKKGLPGMEGRACKPCKPCKAMQSHANGRPRSGPFFFFFLPFLPFFRRRVWLFGSLRSGLLLYKLFYVVVSCASLTCNYYFDDNSRTPRKATLCVPQLRAIGEPPASSQCVLPANYDEGPAPSESTPSAWLYCFRAFLRFSSSKVLFTLECLVTHS